MMMIVIENGLLNKFFILEYPNITRCLGSISTLCPGALPTVLIPHQYLKVSLNWYNFKN
jgi:hypothetical protein